MVFRPWLRRVVARVSSHKRRHNDYFLAERDFDLEVVRERIRADRNGAPLAILLIELPNGHAARRDLTFLSRVLKRRLRITDTPGILAGNQIGVLLPETPSDGAWKVAADICDFYSAGRVRPDCQVHVDSDHINSRIDRDRERGERDFGPVVTRVESLRSGPAPLSKRSLDFLGASVGDSQP